MFLNEYIYILFFLHEILSQNNKIYFSKEISIEINSTFN
jgi:hypothetical protein